MVGAAVQDGDDGETGRANEVGVIAEIASDAERYDETPVPALLGRDDEVRGTVLLCGVKRPR